MVVTFILLLVDVISVLRFAFTIGVANLLLPADGKSLKNRTNWESFEVKFKFRFPFCVCRKERPQIGSRSGQLDCTCLVVVEMFYIFSARHFAKP